jgi:hypothetical protein
MFHKNLFTYWIRSEKKPKITKRSAFVPFIERPYKMSSSFQVFYESAFYPSSTVLTRSRGISAALAHRMDPFRPQVGITVTLITLQRFSASSIKKNPLLTVCLNFKYDRGEKLNSHLQIRNYESKH